MAKKRKLTPKNERFCREYLVDYNQTQAAIRAGFSERSARNIGYVLMTKDDIRARIKELQELSGHNITKESLLKTLLEIVNARIEDIMDPETQAFLPVHQWPEHMKGVVSSIEQDELFAGKGFQIGVTKKVKTWEKTKATEQIAKLLGLNAAEKTELSGSLKITPVTGMEIK